MTPSLLLWCIQTLKLQICFGREQEVYTTTVQTLLFVFSWSEASMVYTFPSGQMVYTLFPCFPMEVVYIIVFFVAL